MFEKTPKWFSCFGKENEVELDTTIYNSQCNVSGFYSLYSSICKLYCNCFLV